MLQMQIGRDSYEYRAMARANSVGVRVRPGRSDEANTAARKAGRKDGLGQRLFTQRYPFDRLVRGLRGFRRDLARADGNITLADTRSGWRSRPDDGRRDADPHTSARIYLARNKRDSAVAGCNRDIRALFRRADL